MRLFSTLVVFSFISSASIVKHDILMFRIGADETYSLSDLQKLNSDLESFRCAWKDSLITENYPFHKIPSSASQVEVAKKMIKSKEGKSWYNQSISYFKFFRFIKRQSLKVSKRLTLNLKTLARSECGASRIHSYFDRIIELEIYFRSRYQSILSSKSSGNKRKLKQSLVGLKNDINQQIEHTHLAF